MYLCYSDHSGDGRAESMMTLRGHLSECGVNLSRKEADELKKVWPEEAIVSGMISHTQVACYPLHVLLLVVYLSALYVCTSCSSLSRSVWCSRAGVNKSVSFWIHTDSHTPWVQSLVLIFGLLPVCGTVEGTSQQQQCCQAATPRTAQCEWRLRQEHSIRLWICW